MNTKKCICTIAACFVCVCMLLCPWCGVEMVLDYEMLSIAEIGGAFIKYGGWFESGGMVFLGITIIVLFVATISMLVAGAVLGSINLKRDLVGAAKKAGKCLPLMGYGLVSLFALATIVAVVYINAELGGYDVIKLGVCPAIVLSAAIAGTIMQLTATKRTIVEKNCEYEGCIFKVKDMKEGIEKGIGSWKRLDGNSELRELSFKETVWDGMLNMRIGSVNFAERYPNYISFGKRNVMRTGSFNGNRVGDVLFNCGAFRYRVNPEYRQVGLHSEIDGSSICSVPSGGCVLVSGRVRDWFLCMYDGCYGWIRREYLEALA